DHESEPQIKELLDNGDRVLKLARAKDAELSRLLTNVQIMLDELRKRRAELAAFLGSGNRTVETLTRVIDRQQEKLLSLLADLRGTLGTLRPATAAAAAAPR